ncbi:sensor histidine kinase [Candidatus Venteria ishoeyi]|uniref:histidine kinase n=1 Tax=Candidatus Venteria ishoeyi TaxID=1899563 RepID=A0A1H6FDS6_9GAMM|nr:ATP-binding protein [Candidatus Venteria ishoeyi]MDM8544860.1 ATP-binding protein [Candidatus Venteria ishoeyi]SEH08197.1 Sensor protein kinase WalK [Candidatus Venteria ishoeyi]
MSFISFTSPPYIDTPPPEKKPLQNKEWKLLRLFNVYRLVLSALFISTYITNVAPNFFGSYKPELYLVVAAVYFLFTLISEILIHLQWWNFNAQVLLQGIWDILTITLLMYASGGLTSGVGVLLVVTIAGCSMLTEGRTAFFFAAIASLAVLLQEVYASIYHVFLQTSYTQAGMLGAVFFTSALLVHILSQRIRTTEALARQRGIHVEHLAQLNEQIVQHIHTGILVIDTLGKVRLCNEASIRLLGLAPNPLLQNLNELLPSLAESLRSWRRGRRSASLLFKPQHGEVEVIASFTRLYGAGAVSSLILLEDATLTTQRAQQLKLASLGRLTASIAHEVRNPLAAISQAGQLLEESPGLSVADKDLSSMILKHCQRVNTIIENVLQLSRQQESNNQKLLLNSWLENFIIEFKEQNQLSDADILLNISTEPLHIDFDPIQLHQVLWNLCENGLRYSQKQPLLSITCGKNPEAKRIYLDIQDNGRGMSESVLKQVFEPFFTTETHGTGLGLYLARELCAVNRGVLDLIENSQTGCRFRIHFVVFQTNHGN